MSELRLLLKLQHINTFRLNEIRSTLDKKQKRRLIMMLVLYIILGLMGTFYASMIAWGLSASGLSGFLPAFSLLLCTTACIMLSVIRSPALFFDPAGWDQLLSLPIHRYTLIAVKMVNLYLSGLSVSLMIVLPHAVFYIISSGLSFYQAIVWLVIAVFSPLLPMAVGITVSAIPTLLLQRLKNRSLLFAILMLPFITWLMLKLYTLPFDGMKDIGLMSTMIKGLEQTFLSIYPPLGWVNGAMQGAAAGLLYFILLNLTFVLGTGLVLLLSLPRLQQAIGSVKLRRSKKRQSPVIKPLWALIFKEARRIASSPLYLLNTGMAMWLTPMSLFLLPFVKPGIIQALIAIPFVQGLLARYLPLMACAMSALIVPATVSISIEGKNAWLMCTAPVSGAVIFLSKALFSLLFCLPPLLLTTVLLTIHLQLSFWLALVCFLLPLALCTFTSVTGLMLDLRFANFDWENEQQLIKSSAQTGFGILTGLLTLAVMFSVLYFAPPGSTLYVSFILAALLVLLAGMLMKRLFKKPIYQIN